MVYTPNSDSVMFPSDSFEKHLQGKHDQSTHSHHADGSHPTHVTSEYGDKVPLTHVDPPNSADTTHNDYEMQHQAASNNGFSVNILNLDEHMPDVTDPNKGPRYYGTGSQSDKESFKALYSLTGDPNQKITVYRGVPNSVKSINNGDWVTLSPSYAAGHVASNVDGGHVLATEVPASALWSDGDSINEFGLDFSTEVHKHLAGKHDQSSHAHGKGSGGVSSKVAGSVLERVKANGGLSVRMTDGSEPPSGFMVSRKGFSKIVEAKDFFNPTKGKEILSSYLKEHKSMLGAGKDYLGIWHNTENKKVYFDISMNVKNREHAIQLGQENNQISIWDVANFEEIETGGTGE